VKEFGIWKASELWVGSLQGTSGHDEFDGHTATPHRGSLDEARYSTSRDAMTRERCVADGMDCITFLPIVKPPEGDRETTAITKVGGRSWDILERYKYCRCSEVRLPFLVFKHCRFGLESSFTLSGPKL